MLVLMRNTNKLRFTQFSDCITYMNQGDCLIVNDTRVIPARLFGHKENGGGRVEALLLTEIKSGTWEALLRPGSRIKEGAKVFLQDPPSISFSVEKRAQNGTFVIDFSKKNVSEILIQSGHIPLPPYINRSAIARDKISYQTIFANKMGAIAAPTAGLHFDKKIIQAIEKKGVSIVPITLHINLGTFKPISVNQIKDHTMHAERYEITPEAAMTINKAKLQKSKIIAVGTSVVRTLESNLDERGRLLSGKGNTELFLHPPMKPRIVDRLLTNFHLPKSTLLMLVSIFSTREQVLNAYKQAVLKKFRFYSYGDCMFFV